MILSVHPSLLHKVLTQGSPSAQWGWIQSEGGFLFKYILRCFMTSLHFQYQLYELRLGHLVSFFEAPYNCTMERKQICYAEKCRKQKIHMCPKNKNLPSELIPTHCVVLASSKCTMLFAKVTQTSLILTPLHVRTIFMMFNRRSYSMCIPCIALQPNYKLVTRIQLVQVNQSF